MVKKIIKICIILFMGSILALLVWFHIPSILYGTYKLSQNSLHYIEAADMYMKIHVDNRDRPIYYVMFGDNKDIELSDSVDYIKFKDRSGYLTSHSIRINVNTKDIYYDLEATRADERGFGLQNDSINRVNYKIIPSYRYGLEYRCKYMPNIDTTDRANYFIRGFSKDLLPENNEYPYKSIEKTRCSNLKPNYISIGFNESWNYRVGLCHADSNGFEILPNKLPLLQQISSLFNYKKKKDIIKDSN